MNHKLYTSVSGMIFILVGLIHLWRIAMGYPLTLGEAIIPVWASWVAVVVTAFMAYQGLGKHRK
jgi:hypothetical protein